ncbi:phage neck terminator protein, partial [Aeromonas veronii]|uniref:phage neck terminator protein n=1 Tax=Aeromonas veronii TaxID=654 RepID=UPI001E5A608B
YADSTNSSEDDAILRAQIRANNLHTLFRSSVAPEFFRRYGISALYADDATNTTLVSDSNQYLHRWSVNLHLSFKNTVTVPQPGFTKMQVVMNSIVTQEEAEKDPIGAGKLHVCDVDVKIPN